MKIIRKIQYILALFAVGATAIALLFSGAAPGGNHVELLQLRSTIWGMNQAAQGAPNTFRLVKDGVYIFAWAIDDAWAFQGINLYTQKAVSILHYMKEGNLVNAKTMGDVVRSLEAAGFQRISPEQLPPQVITTLGALAQVAGVSTSLISILIIPPVSTFPPEYYARIEQWY